MNERIRLLAEQADGVVINKMMTGARQYTFLEDDLEKFAELIVRECIKTVDAMTSPEDSDLYFWTIQNVSKGIKEHFGVE